MKPLCIGGMHGSTKGTGLITPSCSISIVIKRFYYNLNIAIYFIKCNFAFLYIIPLQLRQNIYVSQHKYFFYPFSISL